MASENTKTTKDLSKSYFDVLGICCSSEVPLIEKILKPLEGVKEVSVVVPSKTVIVMYDSDLISEQQIARALNKARLEASVRANGVKKKWQRWPSPYAICCGILLLLSFLKYVYEPLKWLAVGAVAVGAIPIFLRALTSIRNRTIDINILMLIAAVGSLVLRDFWEAATIVFLFTISEWLQSTATHQAKEAISSLVNVVPQKAFLAETGEEVNANEVQLNSILAVKAGEVIPIDGIVVNGECEVDEKTLTGESFPVSKQKNSTVLAGTINLNGYIRVKTTAVAKECVVARMAKLVEDAQTNKSKTQRYIDQIAKYYTPAVVVICISLVVVPTALKLHNAKQWYRLALVVLVSACPCALVLSTPVAMYCALSKAAASGLLFKGTEYLETLAKIRNMAFDKTGTITSGEFSVSQFKTFVHDVDHNSLLYWVSSIEGKSSHPMATAITDYAYLHSIEPKPERVEEFQNFPGEGIYGRIDGMDIFIGNKKISSRTQCTTVPELDGDGYEGKSISYIFLGSSPAGFFSVADVCRTGVKEALGDLKLLGIKTIMLTGDCFAAAKYVQDQLAGALEAFHAELLPEDKAKFIKELQKEAPTAMIGDGINDAPALATADIGISMGVSGSALAMDTGHVILTSNDLRKLPKAVRLARRVRRKIIQNVIISITIKAGILAVAIAGHPLVWAAVFADVGSCLIVIANSLLLLRGTKTKRGTHQHGKCSHAHHQEVCCSNTESSKECKSDCSSFCGNKQSSEKNGCHSQTTLHSHSPEKPSSRCCNSHSCSKEKQPDENSQHSHDTATLTSFSIGTRDIESTGEHGYDCSNHSKSCEHEHSKLEICAPNEHCSSIQSKEHHISNNVKEKENHCIHQSHRCCASTLGMGENESSSNHCHGNHSVNHCKAKGTNEEVHPQCRKYHDTECNVHDSAINIMNGKHHHVDCGTLKALEMRHVGGCCHSYRKECCGRSSHFGSNFGANLSEIVIE